MLRSGLVLAGGMATGALLRFARNVLLARLISVADYGIASTFIISGALVELVGDLALDRMLVQDRDGDDPRMMATLHTLMVARGLIFGLLFYVCAGPIALLFNQPELTWAYEVFALVPVVRGFIHLDTMRAQRRMSFGPMIKAELVSSGGSLLLLWPVALWLGDFRVMLVLLIAQQVLRVLTTHVLARVPYRVGFDIPIAMRAFHFGWPLLLAGILVFFAMQGERVIVANQFSAVELGLFSAALTLAITPALLLANVAQRFLLPLLAAAQDDADRFEAEARRALELMLCAGAGLALGCALIGPELFRIAFGAPMAEGAVYMIPVALSAGFRVAQAGPVTVILARGRTINHLTANLAALVALPIAFWAVLYGGGLEVLILIGAAGLMGANAMAIGLMVWRDGLRAPGRMRWVYALGLVFAAVIAADALGLLPRDIAMGLAGLLFIALVAGCVSIRRQARQILSRITRRVGA
ncbi:MAG: oligosaccharide flippase family protein [Pseudomonadota bacterium]